MSDGQTEARYERSLGTLIYPLRQGESGPEVLMLYRHKRPNLHLWVAPGGKVERDESPLECALRELHEETGLQAERALFRALVTELSPLPGWQWLLFIYVVTDFEGVVQSDEREGRLAWVPLPALAALDLPAADRLFGPAVLDLEGPFFEATMRYDADLKLIDCRVANGVTIGAEQYAG